MSGTEKNRDMDGYSAFGIGDSTVHCIDINRRRLLSSASAILACAGFPYRNAAAQSNYPFKPITFICPWPVGGTADTMMRVLAGLMSKQLSQKVVVKNIAGASGMMGARAITTSPPDGYTIGQIPMSVIRFAELGMVSFNPLKDFTYLARVSGQTFGLAVKADSPYMSLKDLLTAAKGAPNVLTYATAGLAGATHIGMEEIMLASGVKMQHVPYKGGALALADLLAGRVDVLTDSSSWAKDVNEGRLRLLATWGEKRVPGFADVPTLKEVGLNIVVDAPNGIGAPAGLDPDISARLRTALRQSVLSAEFRQVCESLHAPVMYQDGDAYRQYMLSQVVHERQLIDKIQLKRQMQGR